VIIETFLLNCALATLTGLVVGGAVKSVVRHGEDDDDSSYSLVRSPGSSPLPYQQYTPYTPSSYYGESTVKLNKDVAEIMGRATTLTSQHRKEEHGFSMVAQLLASNPSSEEASVSMFKRRENSFLGFTWGEMVETERYVAKRW